METRYESDVKQIAYSQQQVYSKLSDFNHLKSIKEHTDDERLSSLEFDADSITFVVQPVGKICMKVVERNEPDCIKMQTQQSPLPFTFWIQLLATSETTCKMRLTLDAKLNPFIRSMVGGRLQDALNKMADMLAALPYE